MGQVTEAVLAVGIVIAGLGLWAIASAIGDVAGELRRLRQTLLGMDVHIYERESGRRVDEEVRVLR
jgi:hypothetical protein